MTDENEEIKKDGDEGEGEENADEKNGKKDQKIKD